MPKRHLSVRNKENEQQQQTLSIVTRLSSKRLNTNESISIKKPKIIHDDTDVEKENQPKRSSLKSKPISAPIPVPVVTPVVDQHLNPTDDEDEVEEIDYPTSSTTHDKGTDHPTNKQYLIDEQVNQPPSIISKTARYWSLKYRKVIRHVSPDYYDMYIHADFNCYGELEVIENCLLDLTKAVFVAQEGILARSHYVRKPTDKINYVLGFRRLEALTILLDCTDGISGIDDGDRFYDIMRVIGACYVTILRGLLPNVMLEKRLEHIDEDLVKKLKKIARQIPNFKQVLEQSMIVGHMFLSIADICSAYTTILQIVYCNWVLMMENSSIDLNAKPSKFNGQLWNAMKQAVEIEKNGIDNGGKKESFDFINELKLYKRKYSGMGGDSHDLSKWSKTERAEYSLSRYDTS